MQRIVEQILLSKYGGPFACVMLLFLAPISVLLALAPKPNSWMLSIDMFWSVLCILYSYWIISKRVHVNVCEVHRANKRLIRIVLQLTLCGMLLASIVERSLVYWMEILFLSAFLVLFSGSILLRSPVCVARIGSTNSKTKKLHVLCDSVIIFSGLYAFVSVFVYVFMHVLVYKVELADEQIEYLNGVVSSGYMAMLLGLVSILVSELFV